MTAGREATCPECGRKPLNPTAYLSVCSCGWERSTSPDEWPPTCPCGHTVSDHAGWLYDCSRCGCTGPGLPGMTEVTP